jgi:hypothetical protein
MPSVPRIVVVDSTHDVARIVHGAMALLSRQYILIEVPGSQDALNEVEASTIDLVVTAYRVPGEMHGIELATRISHESLGTPTIVLGEQGDPLADDPSLKDAPFQYYLRPVAEPFLRGLRIALDGEPAIAGEESAPSAAQDLGPVPSIEVDDLRSIILTLMRDVGAMGVILADRTGRVLVDEGATGYIDREQLAIIMGPSFARSAEVSPLVGGNAWTMHYYDGERLDVFGLAIGLHFFMGLIFEGSNRGAFGAVTMFGRRAAEQMIDQLGDIAYATRHTEPVPVPAAETLIARPKKLKDLAPIGKTQEEPEPEAADVEPELPVEGTISDFDVDALFGQSIDETMADDMFDPDALGDLAASLPSEGEERVNYDEAINMGILDE